MSCDIQQLTVVQIPHLPPVDGVPPWYYALQKVQQVMAWATQEQPQLFPASPDRTSDDISFVDQYDAIFGGLAFSGRFDIRKNQHLMGEDTKSIVWRYAKFARNIADHAQQALKSVATAQTVAEPLKCYGGNLKSFYALVAIWEKKWVTEISSAAGKLATLEGSLSAQAQKGLSGEAVQNPPEQQPEILQDWFKHMGSQCEQLQGDDVTTQSEVASFMTTFQCHDSIVDSQDTTKGKIKVRLSLVDYVVAFFMMIIGRSLRKMREDEAKESLGAVLESLSGQDISKHKELAAETSMPEGAGLLTFQGMVNVLNNSETGKAVGDLKSSVRKLQATLTDNAYSDIEQDWRLQNNYMLGQKRSMQAFAFFSRPAPSQKNSDQDATMQHGSSSSSGQGR